MRPSTLLRTEDRIVSTGIIRMGVAGLGRVGWPFHCAQIARHRQFRFVAVQDPEPARRREAEKVYGVRSFERFTDMLRESALDAVAIATPTHLHRAMSEEALRAGCHVMLEKPIAMDALEAAAIVRAAARRKRVLTVYQPRRADASFQHFVKLASSGIVGDVYHVRRGMFQLAMRDDWQALSKFGGGMLNNYGAHALDQVLQLVGYDIQRVYCSLRIVASAGDAEDVVKIVLETRSGALGEIDINQASTSSPYFLEAWGTRGTIEIDPTDLEHITVRHFPRSAVRVRKVNANLASPGRRYPEGNVRVTEERVAVDAGLQVDVYDDLARAIRTGAAPFVKPEEPLAVMRLIARCREDAGCILKTPIVGDAEPRRRSPAHPRRRSVNREAGTRGATRPPD